ncbi:hypothetical protein [Tenacibaculum sp. TC6]|uniref:hypothetical protein n=1 Tax=Tenacibaculum sp. TC6 TaxID=3423223 RepID=UPI003D3639E5
MKLYKTLTTILIVLTSTIMFANTGNGPKKHEKNKIIKKQFSVTKNATLYLNNKYGNINVTTWDENRVEIDVKIIVKGNNLSDVNDKLDAITVDFQATNDLVEARTIIRETKSSWSWWKNNNTSFKINYFVKMPITNNADFNNKYGNIEIDVLKGKSNINCDYGNIDIDKLLNIENSIDINYCGSSEINFIESGNISADYSTLKIENSEKLKINADYSTVKANKINTLHFNSDYGSIIVNEGVDVYGNSDYAGVKIGTIHKNLEIDTDYGGVKVENIANGFEKISIKGSYAGIKLGTKASNSFKFTVSLEYASFNHPDEKIEFFKSIKKSSKKYYEGIFGSSHTNSVIDIKSSYGGVSLNIND